MAAVLATLFVVILKKVVDMKAKDFLKIFLFISLLRSSCSTTEGTCSRDESGECSDDDAIKEKARNKYSQESNTKWAHHRAQIENAVATYKGCDPEKCSCHYPLIKKDLTVFRSGIGKDILQAARDRGTFYQIINHKLYREKNCMFPSRCSGIEHFILKVSHTTVIFFSLSPFCLSFERALALFLLVKECGMHHP
ncbi:O-glucosyltransferase rumi homolog [Penaeus indicus]|uniref:O-glucosyltransferase rumi homolog n=1 Tax=Penaeus indicus TaxID=29960 RepID=UPI00300D7E81